ncbi:hypothetical protein DYI37_18760 [Fulvimarina endophytica]|uniref:Uncharacterized protein n=1 Tax=Fulvimarina endophytica TaxID=2293836 RepID=A0A371WY56_9HYPH|nr:hypothetical protein DYI37_18760 [Fulvimarina endophytica]
MIVFAYGLSTAAARECVPPEKPFVPSELKAIERYEDLLRDDFESYLTEIAGYIACLDDERRRAFRESRDVTRDYRLFLDLVDQ